MEKNQKQTKKSPLPSQDEEKRVGDVLAAHRTLSSPDSPSPSDPTLFDHYGVALEVKDNKYTKMGELADPAGSGRRPTADDVIRALNGTLPVTVRMIEGELLAKQFPPAYCVLVARGPDNEAELAAIQARVREWHPALWVDEARPPPEKSKLWMYKLDSNNCQHFAMRMRFGPKYQHVCPDAANLRRALSDGLDGGLDAASHWGRKLCTSWLNCLPTSSLGWRILNAVLNIGIFVIVFVVCLIVFLLVFVILTILSFLARQNAPQDAPQAPLESGTGREKPVPTVSSTLRAASCVA